MPESPTKVVLIVTVGRTDIQVLAKSAGDSPLHYPVPVDRNHQSTFNKQLSHAMHDLFSKESGQHCQYRLLMGLQPADMAHYLEQFQALDERFKNEKNKPGSLFFEFSKEPPYELFLYKNLHNKFEKYPANPAELIPAKLFPIIRQLKLKQKKIDTAIVFNTSRDKQNNNRHADAEPYAFGEVIARWLAHELQLEFASPDSRPEQQPENKAFFCNYLTGNMNAEGEDADYPVSRAGMQCIDSILEAVTQYYKEQETKEQKISVEAFYSPGGGIPAFKSQIEAACHFYFDQVDHWITPDNESEFELKNDWQDAQRYPSPDMSYRARKQALQLIEEGNFEGAAVIAKPFLSDEKVTLADKNWANAVRTTALWFQGGLSLAELNQSLYKASIHIGMKEDATRIPPFENEKQMPNTLWAAFKIEAALRQGNLQDAVRYTCDLRDIALYDLLGKKLAEGNFDTFHNTPVDNKIDKEKFVLVLKKLAKKFNIQGRNNNELEFKDLISNNRSRYKLDTSKTYSKDGNQRSLLLDCAALVDCYKISPEDHPLNRYEQALKTNSGNGDLRARDYRNIITHGYLSSEKSRGIKAHFSDDKVKLWSAPNPETKTSPDSDSKMRFLNQDLVSNLYKQLDSENTLADLYNKLTDTLKEILIRSPICDTAL